MNQSLSPGVDSEAGVSLSLAVAGDVDNGPAVTALSTTISFNIKRLRSVLVLAVFPTINWFNSLDKLTK